MMTRTKGFTQIDLVVAIVCAVILITLAACMTNHRGGHRPECAQNLHSIGKAITMAAADDNYKFPLLWTTGQPEASIKPTGAAPDLEKLKTKLIGREAAMQNMWILLAKEYTVELAFMCPEDNDWVPRVLADNADRDVGWHSSKNFSYGLHFPYRTTTVDGKTVANPAHLDKGILLIDGSFAIMADKNPLNHGDLVRVNALRLSGAIEYLRGESDFEINNDNIYTIQTQNNANLSTPANINDQYIIRHP